RHACITSSQASQTQRLTRLTRPHFPATGEASEAAQLPCLLPIVVRPFDAGAIEPTCPVLRTDLPATSLGRAQRGTYRWTSPSSVGELVSDEIPRSRRRSPRQRATRLAVVDTGGQPAAAVPARWCGAQAGNGYVVR